MKNKSLLSFLSWKKKNFDDELYSLFIFSIVDQLNSTKSIKTSVKTTSQSQTLLQSQELTNNPSSQKNIEILTIDSTRFSTSNQTTKKKLARSGGSLINPRVKRFKPTKTTIS